MTARPGCPLHVHPPWPFGAALLRTTSTIAAVGHQCPWPAPGAPYTHARFKGNIRELSSVRPPEVSIPAPRLRFPRGETRKCPGCREVHSRATRKKGPRTQTCSALCPAVPHRVPTIPPSLRMGPEYASSLTVLLVLLSVRRDMSR